MKTNKQMVLVPDYRGFAYLGTGQYVLNNGTADDGGEEVVISIATEAEKAGRVVGEDRDNPDDHLIQPEDMAVRLRFANVAGVDALMKRLQMARDDLLARGQL